MSSADHWTPPDRPSPARVGILGDQVLSGLSNALAVVLVARVLSPDAFGRFALAYATMTFSVGLTRSYFGNRLVLEPDVLASRALTGALLGALLLVSPLLVAGVLGVSLLAVGAQSLGLLLIVALVTPVVCAQDLVRISCATAGRPAAALVSDGAWVLVMSVALVLPGTLSATGAVAVWGGAAVVAAALALLLTRHRPRLGAGRFELLRRDGQSGPVALAMVASTSASLLLLWLAAHLLGDRSAGSLRGAATTMGPINVLLAFAAIGLTPALVRRDRQDDVPFCALVGFALCGCVLLWGSVLLVLPAPLGRLAFGASWPGIRSVLPWTVTEYALLAFVAAGALGLKVRRAGAQLLQARLVGAFVTLGGGLAVVVLSGSTYAVAALLACAAAAAAAWSWMRLVRCADGWGSIWPRPATSPRPTRAGELR
jgi:O-antigen/teichoic acid export membrane protein